MQYDEFEAVSSERVREVLQGGDFQDTSELEDALIEIRNTQDEIEHIKALKKRRTTVYDQQVKSLEERESTLREAVGRCLISNKKKSLKYPGVGSVSRKTIKGKWDIEDETKLVEHCEDLGIGDDAYERIIKVNKTKMNKVLNDLEKNNNIPDCVKKADDKESLAVTVERTKEEETPSSPKPAQKPVFSGKSDDFDGLDI